MATSAERQRAYRQRQLKDEVPPGGRISVIVDAKAKRTLERLATYYELTQRAMLERLLQDAQVALLKRLEAIPNGIDDYNDEKSRPSLVTV